jgi:hypothetical protein
LLVTADDLTQILRDAAVDPTYYAIGEDRHEALCLLPRGQEWVVFLSERGEHYEERTFSTEDDACVYFLKRVFQLWRRT